jgi:ribonuclease HII
MPSLFKIPTVEGVTKATAKQQMLKQLICTDAPEQALRYHGYTLIAGVDEVGRGALFGPVVAAAVILPAKTAALARMGLKDSKQLTQEDRERLDRKIRRSALAVSIGEVDAATIDRVNIYQASRLAMLLAVQQLPIAAASVVAKVYRDALCRELDVLHPQYGFASHKGYATPEHRRALIDHGPTPLHRMTFAPVAACLSNDPDAVLETQIASGDLFLEEDDFSLPITPSQELPA